MKHIPRFAVLAAISAIAMNIHAEDSFVELFDGRSLTGWEGAGEFWKVDGGSIVGETTAEKQPTQNTFLYYTEKDFEDFELRFQYRVSGYNSGIQYRSEVLPDFGMKGLQADFEAPWHKNGTLDKFSGMFFEEKGRMFLGKRGQVVVVRSNNEDPKKTEIEVIGSVGDPKELEKSIHRDDWNEYTIVAKGNQFMHLINGRVMAIGIDEDHERFQASGKIGFQLHKGKPMKIEIRKIQIRELAL